MRCFDQGIAGQRLFVPANPNWPQTGFEKANRIGTDKPASRKQLEGVCSAQITYVPKRQAFGPIRLVVVKRQV